MKKYLLLMVMIALATDFALAQDRTTKAFSIGPELNIGQRSIYSVGYGVSAKAEFPVSTTLSIVVTGAYNKLHYKNYSINGTRPSDDTYIPLKGGVRYFVDPRFYTEGELGAVISDGNNNVFFQGGNLFTYSLGTGFIIPIGKSKNNAVDLGLRYEDWSKSRFQQFGIRVAYRVAF